MVYTASFFVWGGALTALMAMITNQEGGGAAPTATAIIPTVAILIPGWLLWTVQLARYASLSFRINRDPELRAALNDERRKLITARAMSFGFWAVIIAAGAYFLAYTQEILVVSAAALAIGAIWVGVSVVLSAFLWFDRDEAE